MDTRGEDTRGTGTRDEESGIRGGGGKRNGGRDEESGIRGGGGKRNGGRDEESGIRGGGGERNGGRDEDGYGAASPLGRQAWRWFEDFLCRPHAEIGREGHVCPFVGPAIGAGTLRVEEWETGPEPGAEELTALVHRMADTFEHTQWAGRNRTLHALVVVLNGLAASALPQMDEAHRRAKPQLVRRYLMLGQFHPACDERAARNPELPVSRAPVPMFALRNMAFHDVLFLDENPEWFRAYAERFGRRYTSAASLPDPLFADRYARAREKWLAGCGA